MSKLKDYSIYLYNPNEGQFSNYLNNHRPKESFHCHIFICIKVSKYYYHRWVYKQKEYLDHLYKNINFIFCNQMNIHLHLNYFHHHNFRQSTNLSAHPRSTKPTCKLIFGFLHSCISIYHPLYNYLNSHQSQLCFHYRITLLMMTVKYYLHNSNGKLKADCCKYIYYPLYNLNSHHY